jgi:hypothetical protein
LILSFSPSAFSSTIAEGLLLMEVTAVMLRLGLDIRGLIPQL